MSSIAFVFGNGESRRFYNLDKFKPAGTVIACNAAYRDWTPNILVSSDVNMIAEIIHSGYSLKNKCYFRGIKNRIPISEKKMFMNTGIEMIDYTKPDHDYFLCMGYGDEIDSPDEKQVAYLVGLYENDMARDLTDIKCDNICPEGQLLSYEFSGPQAVDVATKFSDIVYVVGFDFQALADGKTNNVYKNTNNYYASNATENPKLFRSIVEFSDVVARNQDVIINLVADQSKFPVPEELRIYDNLVIQSHPKFVEEFKEVIPNMKIVASKKRATT